MEKEYTVTFSYTIDRIMWDCPVCGNHNESEDSEDDCLECANCGFERATSSMYELGECDCEEEIFTYYDDDADPNDELETE